MPGLDHAPSAMTKRTDADPYGCHNGERGKPHLLVLDGYETKSDATGNYAIPRMKLIDFVMSTECRYDMSLSDKRCSGCKHVGSGEAYDKMVRERGV